MDRKLNSYLSKGLFVDKYFSDYRELRKDSNRKVLKLFHLAAETVPAYKDFLRKNKIKHESIRSIGDFKEVPVTTKENYIRQYELPYRCWDGDVCKTHTFAASSGTSGKPFFWPRSVAQEVEGAQIHELLFTKIYNVQKSKTLFVNSFGLGNWIAGIYTEMCVYLMRLRGIPFTLASPGYNQEETFKVVKGFSHFYDQTIIACHPPILKMMIEDGIEEGIQWKKLNIKFLGAAEGFSESWRDSLLSLVGQDDYYRTMINIYGSADAGLMGFETPLSIALHRETARNHKLNKVLFDSDRNPFLYQFDPLKKYIESINSEITLTMDSTMPLLRYNIHDNGSVIENNILIDTVRQKASQFSKVLRKYKISLKEWSFPFVYIFGRDQFMTTLYGVNIYPENVKAVLEHKELQPFFTGRFIIKKSVNERKNPYIILHIELRRNIIKSRGIEDRARKLFVQILKQLNSEYNQVEDKIKKIMHPKITLHRYNDPVYFPIVKIRKMS